jgi:hypothetical protein
MISFWGQSGNPTTRRPFNYSQFDTLRIRHLQNKQSTWFLAQPLGLFSLFWEKLIESLMIFAKRGI